MTAVIDRPIIDVVRRLFPFHYSVVAQGNDDSLPVWLAELPFQVHEFPSGTEINGWLAGEKWSVTKAEISKDGQLIYDGRVSPLGVITHSQSFSGSVSLDELKMHLFYSDVNPEAIVYHWSALYRPLEKTWGFSVPKRLFESLIPGSYHVIIETQRSMGTLKVLDFVLPGQSRRTILLNAHNCHPFQANDDLSGCAVGIEVMKRLAALPERRYTYRLVIAPELIGTMFWLRQLGSAAKDFVGAILLKAVGNPGPLRLQDSFTGTASLDRSAHHVFRHKYGRYDSGPFRTVYGNDETVFEAPGYCIPTVSLTRMPFDDYHTDRDVPERLSEDHLQDAAETAMQICLTMERDQHFETLFEGLISLSHPRYDLYLPAVAPGLDKGGYDPALGRWNLLMNCLPRYLADGWSLLQIADQHQLSLASVHDYVMRWVAKGLVKPRD